jgi:hypothetical protein
MMNMISDTLPEFEIQHSSEFDLQPTLESSRLLIRPSSAIGF